MIICGIKITHDGGIALIDGNKLVFSTEMEKIANNHRYSGINTFESISEVLALHGYSIDQVDRFVVDGWHGSGVHWKGESFLSATVDGKPHDFPVAGYNEQNLSEDILARQSFSQGLPLEGESRPYSSFMHVTGHVMGTYCASPFAARGESSYVLVWDGGQYPRLYFVDAEKKTISNRGHLFFLLGTAYGIIGQYFGPYKKTEEELAEDQRKMELEGYFGGYSIAGKIMSYIALGQVQEELLQALPQIHRQELEISNKFEHKFCRAIQVWTEGKGYSDADVLRTFHTFIQEEILKGLKKKFKKEKNGAPNLCFAGGSALNIKWNSAIRASGLVKDLFVPPFPNDSGSALGTACAEMFSQTEHVGLDWNVFSGPDVIGGSALAGWNARPCSISELARHLAETNEPIVFLEGAAELGPRALGHRSILSPATSPEMKAILNHAKKREPFRPVAPICLEEDGPAVFSPGCRDEYMLFDHMVKEEWTEKVPAIVHLDGTARLQTVGQNDGNPKVRELLEAYRDLTGIPLLCNTSANLNGSGFFPDAASAMVWGRLNYIWCQGQLFEKEQKVSLLPQQAIEAFA